jgi:2-methylcitrate dehydratase PrpD
MYILAVALEDGRWHHVESYTPERAHRPSTVALWRKIRTEEDPAWTARYHDPDPARKAFGGRVDVELDDGTVATEERLVADAHPNGRRPWRWPDYLEKLEQLAGGRLPGMRASGSSTSPRASGASRPKRSASSTRPCRRVPSRRNAMGPASSSVR